MKSFIKKHISKKENPKRSYSEAKIKVNNVEILPSKNQLVERDSNLKAGIMPTVDSFSKTDLFKLESKLEELKQTMSINFKMIQDRGLKLENLLDCSEKLNASCQDLRVISQKTKKKFIPYGCKKHLSFILYTCLIVSNCATFLYLLLNK